MIESIESLQHTSKHITHWHQHPSGQLYWVSRGMVIVETKHTQWALTPGAIGWCPPDTPHCAWMPVEAKGTILYCNATFCELLPSTPSIRAASHFLLLVLQKITEKVGDDVNPEHLQHLLQVMVDEIQLADSAPSQIILPEDARAKNAAQTVLANTGHDISQVELAKHAGLSTRTLSRLFIQQTGLTFSQWRQKTKILRSLEYLQRGNAISQVALLVGYENVSSYIMAFRRFMGMTPGQFQTMCFN